MQTDSQSPIEFELPESVQLPTGQDNPEKGFDIVCTFVPTGEGRKVCISKIGEADAPGYKNGEKQKEYSKESKPGYGEYSSSIISESGGSGGAPAAGASY